MAEETLSPEEAAQAHVYACDGIVGRALDILFEAKPTLKQEALTGALAAIVRRKIAVDLPPEHVTSPRQVAASMAPTIAQLAEQMLNPDGTRRT